jgi:hypothetical protein
MIQYCNYDIKGTLAVSGNATFAGDVTVNGGDITLGGTGRIQGVDTVSANTDAANKLYVDNAISGVPGQSYINSATFSTSNGIITGTGVGSAGFTVDIDGRYPIGNVALQPFYIDLQQNPVGTTYGNGVSALPTYYFGQKGGDNDHMRFYAESASSNDITAVWEINDDIETGLTWLFRNKKTYSPYTATDALKIDGDGDITVGKDLTITGGDIILSGTGRIQGVDTVSASTDAANKAYVDASVPTVNNGTLTMTTSTGLDGGATFTANQSGNSAFAVSLDLTEISLGAGLDSTATGLTLDLSEFTDMTAGMTATDEFIVLDSGAERRKAAGEIGNSIFSNTAGYITSSSLPTVNNATITINAGTNLTTGGNFTTNQGVNETITINMATGGVGAGTYGSTSNSTKIDIITVDAYGRVTGVTTGATGQVNTINSGNTNTLTSSGSTTVTLTPVTGTVSSSSSNLATGAQIQTAINSAVTGVLKYQGTWNASSNSPTLTSGSGTPGYYYIVSTAGSTNLDGITDWAVGDWAVFSDQATDAWQKIDNTQVGNVTGSGSNTRLAVWNSASNITSDSGLTFNTSTNLLTIGGQVNWSGGSSAESNSAYDNMITGFSDSGSSTITLTLTQNDGGTLSTSFSNPQGTTTPSNTQTFTNKSGNISQWTNDSGYITSASLPTVGNGQINGATSGNGLSGSMSATANQSGNSTFTVTSNATTAATASTIAYRDSSADISARLFRANYANQSTISGAIAFRVNNSSDNYTRYCSSPSAIRTFIGAGTGDLTAIVAGAGLTGTSLSGPVPTLNAGAGTGITVNADDIAVTPAQTGITSIHYDGLEVGGVSGVNEIEFSADKIAFRANSTNIGNMHSGGFRPTTTNTMSLGTSSLKWASVYATTLFGDLNGTINTSTTGVTQSQGNNSTKIATTAYVDSYDSGVQVINEGVGIKKSGSSTDVTISVNYDSGDTDNLIFGANGISAAVAVKPYTPFILAADSNPGVPLGEVKNLRLQSIPLDRFGDATSTIDMGANRILDVADPTSAQDAATKAYVDANSGSGTVTGTGVSNRIAFWTNTSSIASDSDLTYNLSLNRLVSGNYLIPNNGDYLGTDTSSSIRTLLTLDSSNNVEISNQALSTGSDTNIYFGDNFRIKDGSSTRFSIQSNGTISGNGNTFNSGPINLEEDNKIIFDNDGDQWNYVQVTSGNMEMGVGGNGLVLQNIEESIYGNITVEQFYNTVNLTTNTNATYIPVYTSASGSTPQVQRQQTPARFLENAGAVLGAPATSGRVAVWTGSGSTSTIDSDTLYWNTSTNVLGINYSGSTFSQGALQIQGPTGTAGGIGLQIYNSTTGSPYGAHGIFVNGPRYGNAGISVKNPNTGSTFMRFYNNSGSSVGTITQFGSSSTSYNTSSDYRLKENIEPMSGSIERIKALKPCKFNFIEEESDERGIKRKVDGFIAHEAAGVVPEAVTGQKDETDYKGDPEYQSIDQSKLVPLLTSALQEALAKIELLETRLDTLEQKK